MNSHHHHFSGRTENAGYLLILICILMVSPSCSTSNAHAANQSRKDAIPVAGVVDVTRQNLSNTLEIASEFVPYQEIDVHAKVSGYVKRLYVDWGTRVKTGQLLAVLDVPELKDQVSHDKAAVLQSLKGVQRAKEELVRDRSGYEVAELTYKRLFKVQALNPHLVAQEEVDVARGKDLESQAAVSADSDALAAAQEELAAARSTVERDEAMADYAKITAPFPGVVTRLDAYTGALLPAGTSSTKTALALCHLAQDNPLRLVIPVPERVVPDVHLGEPVTVKVPALDKTFKGKVSRISDDINLDTRTMHTEIEVPNSESKIVPGMYAYVDLPVHSVTNALAIPIQAVVRSGTSQGTVLVVSPKDRIEQRDVQLGLETANRAEVLSGLREGELVVFGEQARYTPGEKVKVKNIDSADLMPKGH